MEDVTRKRLMRKLEELPEEQLYQVLDFIEYLELKYARETGRKPDPFQQFAEKLEDQMRVRSLAPRAMKGTMKMMSTAGRVLDGVRSFGKDLVTPPDRTATRAGGRSTGKAGGDAAVARGTDDETGDAGSADASEPGAADTGQSGEG